MTAMLWREQAACVGMTDTFFRDAKDSLFPWSWDEARMVCVACPVLADCRVWALTSGDDHGFAAGMTPQERRHQMARADRRRTG